MKRKQIIISIYDDLDNPYYGGGGAVAVYNIAKRLASSYEVTVLTGNYHGARNKRLGGIIYQHIGPASFGPKISQLIFSILLPWYIKRMQFDLWIESFTPPFSTSFLPLFTNKPVVGYAQMLASEDMRRKYKLPFHLVESAGLKKYQHCIVLTEQSKQKLLSIQPNTDVQVIPVGIDMFPTTSKSGKKYILYTGRIEFNQKGLDLLLDAFSLIAHATPYQLFIAGSGNKKDIHLLKHYINDKKLNGKVRLLGKVSGKKKISLFQNASAVIVPSRFETFAIVALEAMSYGKPLIGFDIEGLNWIPKDCMIRIKPFDTKRMSSKIAQVLDGKIDVGKMSSLQRLYAKKYLWNSISRQYEKAIENILNTSS